MRRHHHRSRASLRLRPRLLQQVEAILAGLDILPLDVPADVEYGGICAELEAAGRPIGPSELLIVLQALALGATLVIAKVGEFARFRGRSGEN